MLESFVKYSKCGKLNSKVVVSVSVAYPLMKPDVSVVYLLPKPDVEGVGSFLSVSVVSRFPNPDVEGVGSSSD